jgi:hypothetical protein
MRAGPVTRRHPGAPPAFGRLRRRGPARTRCELAGHDWMWGGVVLSLRLCLVSCCLFEWSGVTVLITQSNNQFALCSYPC